jgi:hypothetical protein
MERRYVCGLCGMKWFDPLPARRVEPVPCGACGGALLPLVGHAAPRWFADAPEPDDAGNGDVGSGERPA